MDPSVNDPSFVHRNAPLSEAQKLVESFWRKEAQAIQNMNFNDFRNPELPLARIKKIMKLDEDVKMISGEAPVLFAKAVEIFIAELSLRAWVNTEENKRRTLQRNDIATGISKYDQFDFLIDIVPREEAKPVTTQVKRPEVASNAGVVSQDPLNYYFQVAQGPTGQAIQVIQAGAANQSQQQFAIAPQVYQLPVQNTTTNQSQDNSASVLSTSQMAQLGNQVTDGSQATNGEKAGGLAAATTASAPIILSNVYGNNGEVVQQMPITLTQQQYQALLQNQGTNQSGQPILIQSNPQSLSMPAQYITNAGQVMQAIIPNAAAGSIEQGTSAGKVQSQTDES